MFNKFPKIYGTEWQWKYMSNLLNREKVVLKPKFTAINVCIARAIIIFKKEVKV